jgi:hypothetical protein
VEAEADWNHLRTPERDLPRLRPRRELRICGARR